MQTVSGLHATAPGRAAVSPDDLASISHATQGQMGLEVVSGQGGVDSGTVTSSAQNNDRSSAVQLEPVRSEAARGDAAVRFGSSSAVGYGQDQLTADASSAFVAQPIRSSNAGSVQSASGVALSSGRSDVVPGQLQEALGQHQPSEPQVPSKSEQTAFFGTNVPQLQGQLRTALPIGEVEQRNLEEQEVLFNMTGQTGSLMYMAPEVISI